MARLRSLNLAVEIIQIKSIPEQIEQREAEKTCFSNLVLELFRDSDPPNTELELVCSSCAVDDQLHSGRPDIYLVVYLTHIENCNKEYYKHALSVRIEGLLSVLHRMGYMTTRYGTSESNPLTASLMIPSGLQRCPVYLVYNTTEKADHQLLSIGIPAAFDNLIAMMADIPNSLFSILLRADGDHIGFNIQVFATEEMQARLIYLNFSEGMKNTFVPKCEQVLVKDFFDYWQQFRMNSAAPFAPLSYAELSNVLQLPFGSRSGIPVTPHQRRLPLFQPSFINGSDVLMGDILGYQDKTLTLPLQRLVGHMSVLGISGSGKSNFLLYYLNEMYNKYGIPFIVIDPVSTEYRRLKASLKDGRLNVFTPGAEVSPFEFNLFGLSCDNLTVREYKSVLKDYLRNSLQMFMPLDKLIDETVDAVFLEHGWLDVSTMTTNPGRLFTIAEFIKTFDRVFAKSRFKGNLENIVSSGRVRLNALRRYFDTVAPLPLADILSVPTVVELGALQSVEAKSTMLLYLLAQVKLYMMDTAAHYRKQTGEAQVKKPSLILVIDEAHSILEMQEHREGMNVAQHGLVDTINQLLLEFRKYGLSVVVSDQRVSVLQDVLTNTHVQVVFKQIDPVGKQVVADIISLDEVQMLAAQQTGEAFVKHEKLEKPVQVKMPKYTYEFDTSDELVADYMLRDFWIKHPELTRPFVPCIKRCAYRMCHRRLRSIVSNVIQRFLMAKGSISSEVLHHAAIQPDSPLVSALVKRIKEDKGVERCVRIHLLQASLSAPPAKKSTAKPAPNENSKTKPINSNDDENRNI